MLSRRLLLLLLTPLFAPAAAADWPPGGRYVTSSAYYGTKCVWIHGLPSNDLLVRVAAVGGNSNHYFVQRLTAAGEVSSGWPTGRDRVRRARLAGAWSLFRARHLATRLDRGARRREPVAAHSGRFIFTHFATGGIARPSAQHSRSVVSRAARVSSRFGFRSQPATIFR